MEQGIMYQYTPQKRKPNLLSIRPRLLHRLPLARLLQVRFLHIDLSFYLRFQLILRFWFVTSQVSIFPRVSISPISILFFLLSNRFSKSISLRYHRFQSTVSVHDLLSQSTICITDFSPQFGQTLLSQCLICITYHSPRFCQASYNWIWLFSCKLCLVYMIVHVCLFCFFCSKLCRHELCMIVNVCLFVLFSWKHCLVANLF